MKYMPAVQTITLTSKERKKLQGMLRKGRWTARQLKRAQVLLLADAQKELTNAQIGERLFCARETVRHVRERFLLHGLENALSEYPRSGQPKKITKEVESFLVSLCLQPTPIGYVRWTLPLLQKRLRVEKKCVVSTETIRRILSK